MSLSTSTPQRIVAYLLALSVLFSCGKKGPEVSGSIETATADDPTAHFDKTDLSASEVATLCESVASRLTSQQRQRCSRAHLEVALQFLEKRDYEAARNALAFAETEGAPLAEVRDLRRRIPQTVYAHHSASDRVANERSTEAARAVRGSAAMRLTITFASSRLREWDIRATAAGENCDLLLVTFYVVMEDPMIDAVHYGKVIYGEILPGGVSGFAAQNGFRGVLYRDGNDKTWSYGDVSAGDAESTKACD